MWLSRLALLHLVVIGSGQSTGDGAGSGFVPRFILNQSLATSTCSATFNTPCAITNVHDIVDALVGALADSAALDAVLDQVRSRLWRSPHDQLDASRSI